MKGNHAILHTLVLRLWREHSISEEQRWQGTLLHPSTGKEIHFMGEEGLSEKISTMLKDLGSDTMKGELK